MATAKHGLARVTSRMTKYVVLEGMHTSWDWGIIIGIKSSDYYLTPHTHFRIIIIHTFTRRTPIEGSVDALDSYARIVTMVNQATQSDSTRMPNTMPLAFEEPETFKLSPVNATSDHLLRRDIFPCFHEWENTISLD